MARLPPRFQRLQGSIIKQIAARATPSSISLAGGIPHESTFVFQSVEVRACARLRPGQAWMMLAHPGLSCCLS